MGDDNSKSLDLLGIKEFGESIKIATEKTFDGVGALLSRICLPVAEEFGLLIKDRVQFWRARNLASITAELEKIRPDIYQGQLKAHPRVVMEILEKGSWAETDELQHMWAGILASACTPDGKDDSNLLFINCLNQLTGVQVKLLNYICQESVKFKDNTLGLVYANEINLSFENLVQITGVNDIYRLDRELDNLRSLELIPGGFIINSGSNNVEVTPSPLALQLYVRCQGYLGSPLEYFHSEIKEMEAPSIKEIVSQNTLS
jgi:hypothetical protein